jgi:hypothetical protein
MYFLTRFSKIQRSEGHTLLRGVKKTSLHISHVYSQTWVKISLRDLDTFLLKFNEVSTYLTGINKIIFIPAP